MCIEYAHIYVYTQLPVKIHNMFIIQLFLFILMYGDMIMVGL